METSRTDSQIDTAATRGRTAVAIARGQSASKFSHFAVKPADKVQRVNKGGGDRLRNTASTASHVAEAIATRAAYSFQDIESKARRGAEEVATLGGLVELLIFVAVIRAHGWIRLLVMGGARDGAGDGGRGSLPGGGPDLAQA
jgi:hypothetical protein